MKLLKFLLLFNLVVINHSFGMNINEAQGVQKRLGMKAMDDLSLYEKGLIFEAKYVIKNSIPGIEKSSGKCCNGGGAIGNDTCSSRANSDCSLTRSMGGQNNCVGWSDPC